MLVQTCENGGIYVSSFRLNGATNRGNSRSSEKKYIIIIKKRMVR